MSEKTRSADVVILGAGSAGLTARKGAQRAGASVRMIDPGPLGTTCARVGCMPSKLLIAAADAAHHVREAHRFGVHAGEPRIDGRAVMERVRHHRDRFAGSVVKSLEPVEEAGDLLRGRATIVGPGRLDVEGVGAVAYDRLVIATGTSPFVPPPFRGLERLSLTNEDVFELETLPESLLVIGLGAIGLELGQAMHRLGVRVTLLGVGDVIGPITDPEVRAVAGRVFGETLDLHPSYTLESVEEVDGAVRARFVDSKGAQRDETYARLLLAAGRRTTLPHLGLEALGVERGDDGGYPIDPATLQLADLPVFVAGDVNELHPLLHEAADDGRIAGANAARYPDVQPGARRAPLGIVFSDPQIAIVGGGYEALGACEAAAGELPMAHQGRARIQGRDQGLLRIYAEQATGRLRGAEIFGPGAEHLGHLLAWAVQAKMTVQEALDMPYYHPVLEEGVRSALGQLLKRLGRGELVRCPVEEPGIG